jgi:tetratricopeptide (TPR) repeat protein
MKRMKKTEKLLRQSIAIDSTYAPAWVALSERVYESAFSFYRRTIPEGNKIGKMAINKAIALDDQNAWAYANLAYFNINDWDFVSAERNVNKALALEPNNSEIMLKAAGIVMSFGKKDEAIANLKKAITIDPLNYNYYFNLSLYQSWNGQNDEAEASINKYMLMYPNAGFSHNSKASILLANGKYEQALVEAEKHYDPFWGLYRKSMVVYALGREEEANKLLKQLVDEYSNKSWPNIAHVYAHRGEKDEAFKWLELALENKDGSLLEILNYPEFKSLYGDPRWNTFINKLGLPKDHGFHMD